MLTIARFGLFNLILILTLQTNAQRITHGPVFGAVTHQSARVYVRTSKPNNVFVWVSKQPNFTKYETLEFATEPKLNNAVIFTIENLDADTRYYIKLISEGVVDSGEVTGSFKTFPKPGAVDTLLIVTGSCQESVNMKTFDRMAELKPDLMVHTGDFTYPSYQMNDDYPRLYTAVQESYLRRYNENRMREMLYNVPIAYVPDDDDGWGDSRTQGSAGMATRKEQRGKKVCKVNYLRTVDYPDVFRHNCFRGYVENFPSYTMPDTADGLYQSFVMGNTEFFMLDARCTADLSSRQFSYDSLSNKWSFTPDTSVNIISKKQMDWLLNGLKNSTAQWKFITTGLPFNQSLKHLISMGIAMQDVAVSASGDGGSGFRLATSFGRYWAGYPHQLNQVLGYIKTNNIKDVLVISGDTHHNVMDDGTNAGLPELNASGLAVAGTFLSYYMNLLSKVLGYPSLRKYIWNQGGGGLGNKNFKNQYGKVEVVGNQYVQYSVVDEDGKVLASFPIYHSTHPKYKDLTKLKTKPYQRRLERRFAKNKPTAWMRFIGWGAKVFYKQN